MSDLKHEVIAKRWSALIKERADSGMTIKEWCQERNIRESQYYYWLRILRQDEADAAGQNLAAAPFVELPAVCHGQEIPGGRPAAVIRRGGVAIEISESASPGFIAKILEAAAHAW